MGLGGEICFCFSARFQGEEGVSGSNAKLSAVRPDAGLEWAEAAVDRGAATKRPMFGVKFDAIGEAVNC